MPAWAWFKFCLAGKTIRLLTSDLEVADVGFHDVGFRGIGIARQLEVECQCVRRHGRGSTSRSAAQLPVFVTSHLHCLALTPASWCNCRNCPEVPRCRGGPGHWQHVVTVQSRCASAAVTVTRDSGHSSDGSSSAPGAYFAYKAKCRPRLNCMV